MASIIALSRKTATERGEKNPLLTDKKVLSLLVLKMKFHVKRNSDTHTGKFNVESSCLQETHAPLALNIIFIEQFSSFTCLAFATLGASEPLCKHTPFTIQAGDFSFAHAHNRTKSAVERNSFLHFHS
jgi:hypothetical protein